MTFINEQFILNLNNGDIIDITPKIQNFIVSLDINDAILNVSVKSNNCAVITLDYHIAQNHDVFSLINSITEPKIDINKGYNPDLTANIKSEVLGKNKSFSIINKQIQISDKEKIAVINCSYTVSKANVIISVVY